MKTTAVIGILLIILGVVSLAYQGITYTKDKETVDLGPVEFDVKEKDTIPLPPVIGGVALVGGILMVVVSKRR